MRIFYHDLFTFPLPDGHRFPIQKYVRLRERIINRGLGVPGKNLIQGPRATDEQLLRAHDSEYIQKVQTGHLSEKEIRRLGFPWSAALVERSRRSVGSTITACRAALADGIGINLAGGTHHAGRLHGEGFCVFNDVAIAARTMQAEGRVHKVAVLDCDVHQGNGTAAILSGDESVFTFSIHAEKNFPFRKSAGDLDIGLPDKTEDDAYLAALRSGIQHTLEESKPEFAIFLAGADPFNGDRLGRLALTKDGLSERDRLVLQTCAEHDIPLAIVMSGGYANDLNDIVDIHYKTVQLACGFIPRN